MLLTVRVRADKAGAVDALLDEIERALLPRRGVVAVRRLTGADDPGARLLSVEFASVGDGRRALGAGDVRMALLPLASLHGADSALWADPAVLDASLIPD